MLSPKLQELLETYHREPPVDEVEEIGMLFIEFLEQLDARVDRLSKQMEEFNEE